MKLHCATEILHVHESAAPLAGAGADSMAAVSVKGKPVLFMYNQDSKTVTVTSHANGSKGYETSTLKSYWNEGDFDVSSLFGDMVSDKSIHLQACYQADYDVAILMVLAKEQGETLNPAQPIEVKFTNGVWKVNREVKPSKTMISMDVDQEWMPFLCISSSRIDTGYRVFGSALFGRNKLGFNFREEDDTQLDFEYTFRDDGGVHCIDRGTVRSSALQLAFSSVTAHNNGLDVLQWMDARSPHDQDGENFVEFAMGHEKSGGKRVSEHSTTMMVDSLRDIRKIQTDINSGSVWILRKSGGLSFKPVITEKGEDVPEFAFLGGVADFAVTNDSSGKTHLFTSCSTTQAEVTHRIFDPISNTWHAEVIRVHSDQHLKERVSCVTTISFEMEDKEKRPKFYISSDKTTLVSLNGKVYYLDAHEDNKIKVDMGQMDTPSESGLLQDSRELNMGNEPPFLHISQSMETNSHHKGHIYITLDDDGARPIVIDSSSVLRQKTRDKSASIKNGKVTDALGKHPSDLVPADSKNAADAAFGKNGKIIHLMNSAEAKLSHKNGVLKATEKHMETGLPANTAGTVTLHGMSVRNGWIHTRNPLEGHGQQLGWSWPIPHFVKEAVHGVEHVVEKAADEVNRDVHKAVDTVKKAAEYVEDVAKQCEDKIDAGLAIAIKFGEHTIHMAVDSLEDVMKVVQSVWNAVKAAAKSVVKFLAELLSLGEAWQEAKNFTSLLEDTFKNGLNGAEKQVKEMMGNFSVAKERIKNDIDTLKREFESNGKASPISTIGSGNSDVFHPKVAHFQSQARHGKLTPHSQHDQEKRSENDAEKKKRLAAGNPKKISDAFTTLDGLFSLMEQGVDIVLSGFEEIVKIIVEELVETMRNLVKNLKSHHLSIPLVGPILKLLNSGELPSLLEICCFVVMVPTIELMKLSQKTEATNQSHHLALGDSKFTLGIPTAWKAFTTGETARLFQFSMKTTTIACDSFVATFGMLQVTTGEALSEPAAAVEAMYVKLSLVAKIFQAISKYGSNPLRIFDVLWSENPVFYVHVGLLAADTALEKVLPSQSLTSSTITFVSDAVDLSLTIGDGRDTSTLDKLASGCKLVSGVGTFIAKMWTLCPEENVDPLEMVAVKVLGGTAWVLAIGCEMYEEYEVADAAHKGDIVPL